MCVYVCVYICIFLTAYFSLFLVPFHITLKQTRLQVQEKVAGEGSAKYRGVFQTMVLIAREEGFMTLYKGLLPRMLRVPPGMAITWGVTDFVVQKYETM